MLDPFVTAGAKDELLQDAGDSGASLSCRIKPVDGASHDNVISPPAELILTVLIAGVPATRTGIEVTTGWPVM